MAGPRRLYSAKTGFGEVQVLHTPTHLLARHRLFAVLAHRRADGLGRNERVQHAAVPQHLADPRLLSGALAAAIDVLEDVLVQQGFRGFSRVLKDNDLFQLLAVTGLLVQFAVQAIINMASNINLMPPKGMTLPFVSYGGSSTLALAVGMGMVLALTRDRPGGRRPR